MQKIKNINAKEYRERAKGFCRIWLDPLSLSAKQIRDTIDDFDCAVTFYLHSEEDDDRLAGFTAALVEDIIEMDSISEEEKDQAILDLIHKYPEDAEQLASLASRTIEQIDKDVENYEKEALERGYCRELVKKRVDG